MSGLRSPIFLRLGKYNKQVIENEQARFRASQRSGVIDQEKYSLSIHRVVIPTSRIEHFSVDEEDSGEYFVMVTVNLLSFLRDQNSYGIGELLDSRSNRSHWLSSTQSLGPPSQVQDSIDMNMESYYNGSADLIYENINRAFQRAYIGALYHGSVSNTLTAVRYMVETLQDKYTIVADEVVSGGVIELGRFDFMPGSQELWDAMDLFGEHHNNKVAAMMIEAEWLYNNLGFYIGHFVEGYDEMINDPPDLAVTAYVKLELVAPSYRDSQGNLVQKKFTILPAGKFIQMTNVVISEGGMIPLASEIHKGSVTNTHAHPIDSFQDASEIIFMDTDTWSATNPDQKGVWVMNMHFHGPAVKALCDAKRLWAESHYAGQYANSNFQIVVKKPDFNRVGLHCWRNFNVLPTLVPTIGKNDAGQTEMQLQSGWLAHAASIYLSPRLNDLLNMGVGYNNEVEVQGQRVYQVISPRIYTSSPTLMNYIVLNTGAHKEIVNHTNIKSIDIVASGLNVNSEIQGDESANDVLMSLIVNPDSLNNTQMVYNYGGPAVPAKRFYFTTPGRLAHFEILIYVSYKDGHRKLLDIGPGEFAEVLLSFDPLFRR